LVWLKGWWLLRGRRVETFIQGLHMYFLRYAGRPVNGFMGQDQRSITLSGIALLLWWSRRRIFHWNLNSRLIWWYLYLLSSRYITIHFRALKVRLLFKCRITCINIREIAHIVHAILHIIPYCCRASWLYCFWYLASRNNSYTRYATRSSEKHLRSGPNIHGNRWHCCTPTTCISFRSLGPFLFNVLHPQRSF
jgi:hypothetical protein